MEKIEYSKQNLKFLLYDVFQVLDLTKFNYFEYHNADTIEMILDSAESIAKNYLRPYFKENEQTFPVLQNNIVTVHPAIKTYYEAYCNAGLMSACLPEKYGGIQLPKTIYATADFIIGNAHNGFEMFTSLASAASNLITQFASEDLIEKFALPILKGDYTATMCLTETQAGSSLKDITTEAVLQNDTYFIKGQKIFISAGDHNLDKNIVHLVLAKIKTDNILSQNISLFIVPKYVDENNATKNNDVLSVGVYHKMGQNSTPAMHLEFGANNKCQGYLIGEAGKGLQYMFLMMNLARLGVGLAGTYIASAAYYNSLQYAKERLQGRSLNSNTAEQIPIIQHPDIRRMLLYQKSFVEGCLGLLLQCYYYSDLLKVETNENENRYSQILDLLTPVAKTVGAEMGIESVNQGLQILGGYGYTKDFILEQLARDVRILNIYEGTTGIQSQTLLGRQLFLNNGEACNFWKEEVNKDILKAKQFTELQDYANKLTSTLNNLDKLIAHLISIYKTNNKELFLSDANLFMQLFGIINMAWQWLKQGTVAQEKLKTKNNENDEIFFTSKIETMQYFFHYVFIKCSYLFERLQDTKQITLFKNNETLI